MIKKTLILLVLMAGVFSHLEAQEANKFRFDIRLGYAIPNTGGGGILFNLEPKWTLNENMNVGLRLGVAAYGREIENNINTDIEVGVNASYIGTYDYYFHNGSSSFAPFVGGGVGYYQVANIEVDDNSLQDNTQIDPSGKFGGMFRAGFDVGKFRVAGEYNLVGKSDLRDVNNAVIGTSKNGYIGISIGAYFGGGKWKK
ncbi:MAG: hypothetical protein AB8B59_15290 [Maribacter sp.]